MTAQSLNNTKISPDLRQLLLSGQGDGFALGDGYALGDCSLGDSGPGMK